MPSEDVQVNGRTKGDRKLQVSQHRSGYLIGTAAGRWAVPKVFLEEKNWQKLDFHFRWLNTCQKYLVYIIYNMYVHNINVYSYWALQKNPHDHHPVGFIDLAGPFIFKSWCHSRLAGKISEKKCLFLHSFQDSKKRDVVTFIHLSIHHYRLQTLRFFGRNQCLSEALLAKARKG